jgi:hypothetical protein
MNPEPNDFPVSLSNTFALFCASTLFRNISEACWRCSRTEQMRPSSSYELKVIIAIFREAMAFPLSVLESRTSFTTYSPAKEERISTIVPQLVEDMEDGEGESPVVGQGMPLLIVEGFGLGVGTTSNGLTPALPISTEPNGIPIRGAPPGEVGDVAADDEALLLELVPHVPAVAAPPGNVPVPAPSPPPSKFVPEPDVPNDGLPMAKHVVPFPVIPIVPSPVAPMGIPLSPGDVSSVAPMVNEGVTFDRMGELTGAKYPLLAYLYFLQDMDRFMPVQPTTFDRAFRGLGIELVTLRNCSWENYQRFNAALGEVRTALASIDGLSNVRLIDAHSFCWLLERLDDDGDRGANAGRKDAGRIVGGREKSIIAMRFSVENTVKNCYGQIIQRTVKNKELRMTSAELEKLLAFLLDLQGNRCALTGIPFHFHAPASLA